MWKVPKRSWSVWCLWPLLAASAVTWVLLIRTHFTGGYWYSDDSYFRTQRPLSLFDILALLLNPTDASGYYRPLQTIVFQFARLLPEQSFSSYQWITISFVLAGGLAALGVARRITDSRMAGAIAALFYIYSAVHLKPLAWVNQWYQPSAVAFAGAALYFRLRLLAGESRVVRIFSLFCWYLAMASNNGIHSFALVLVGVDLLCRSETILNRVRASADVLLLSSGLFLYIYVFHSPLQRAGIPVGQFFDLKAVSLAFFDYVRTGFFHFPGDARTWLGPSPPWYETFAGFFVFAASCALPRWNSRLWVVPLAFVGGGFVIALHHHRWSVEYAAPLAFADALFAGAVCALFIRGLSSRFPRAWRAFPVAKAAIVLVLAACLPGLLAEESRSIVGFYVRDEGMVRKMMESLARFDAALPPGIPFLVRVHDRILAGAPVLHYLVFAADLDFERRPVLFDSRDFQTGEGLGMISADFPLVKVLLEELGPGAKAIDCDADGCAMREAAK